MPRFHVAAGILRDARGRVLIAERLGDGPFEGLWEFPGGKIAVGEGATDALNRELAEELGVEVREARPYMTLNHRYPDREVVLEFFLVTAWTGVPASLESQRIRWVHPADLDPSELLPADAPVLWALRGERQPGSTNA